LISSPKLVLDIIMQQQQMQPHTTINEYDGQIPAIFRKTSMNISVDQHD